MTINAEVRSVDRLPEVREQDGKRTIVGYAAVFGVETDLGWYREKIRRGAFSATLRDKPDKVALVDHNPQMVLGRVAAGTLRLWEDQTGYRFEIDPPNTSYANDLIESLRRGDIRGASFNFLPKEESWRDDDPPLRELIEVENDEVSVVTFPAYADTSAALRSRSSWQEQQESEIVADVMGDRSRRLRLAEAEIECRGRNLSRVLTDLVNGKTTEERPRESIISDMASNAGIEPGTVNQILDGDIDCPPLDRLRGFAESLGVPLSRLQNAAEEDGCSYDEANSRGCKCSV